jgi:hypothetical protein
MNEEKYPPFLPIGPRTDRSVGPGKTSACDLAGCGRTTMYAWISAGKVRAWSRSSVPCLRQSLHEPLE